MIRLKLNVAILLIFTISVVPLVSSWGNWTQLTGPAPWAREEGENGMIISSPASAGNVTVINDGPGEIQVKVMSSPVQIVNIKKGDSKTVGYSQGDDVYIKDIWDAQNNGSGGTYEIL